MRMRVKDRDARFEFQLKMLEKGAEEIQKHIGRLDDTLFKIKASAITVWVALIGWAFTTKNLNIITIGFVVILCFWLLEGLYQGVQLRCLDKSEELTRLFNDTAILNRSFKSLEFPANSVYPLNFRETEVMKLKMYWRGLIFPSVATLYLFLATINLFILMFSAMRN